MPTPVVPNPELLTRRLDLAAKAWLKLDPFFAAFTLRTGLEDSTAVDPEKGPTNPIIVVESDDQGRVHKLMPIRSLRLWFKVRANSKAPSGQADAFAQIGGRLEQKLDTTNLVQAWTTATIAVMLTKRIPGIQMRTLKLVREGGIGIECNCVAAELTTDGTGVVG